MSDLKDISFESRKPLLLSLMQQKNEQTQESSQQAWRIFSKAKGALEDGIRLENISWRLFHMNLASENPVGLESIYELI
jgi:hypothetical protein